MASHPIVKLTAKRIFDYRRDMIIDVLELYGGLEYDTADHYQGRYYEKKNINTS